MVIPAPNEHPFSPRAPRGLFFARDLPQAKKEASPLQGLPLFGCPLTRAWTTAWAATLTVSAAMPPTTATARWHEYPAARQRRQQRDHHSRLG